MKRLIPILLLSACSVPDQCYTNRHEIDVCEELLAAGMVEQCECQQSGGSGSLASLPQAKPEPRPARKPLEPHDHSEPGDNGGRPHNPDRPHHNPREDWK